MHMFEVRIYILANAVVTVSTEYGFYNQKYFQIFSSFLSTPLTNCVTSQPPKSGNITSLTTSHIITSQNELYNSTHPSIFTIPAILKPVF